MDSPPPSARILQALARFALGGASIVLGLQFIGMRGTLSAFVTRNELAKPDRTLLLLTLLGGAAVPVLIAGLTLLFTRMRALARVDAVSRVFAPFVVCGLLPPLLLHRWRNEPLNFLALLVVATMLVRFTVPVSLAGAAELAPTAGRWLSALGRPFRWLKRVFQIRAVALCTVLSAAAAYTVYTSYLTITNLHRLLMGGYDMGYYDNQLANSLAGHFFRNTIMFGAEGGNSLASHAEFGHFLLLPFYALRPGSETLLVLQASLVGFAALPLFLFAETQVSRAIALLLSLAYLAYAPIHGAQFYDFHYLTITVFFFFWLFYGIAVRKNWLVAAAVLVLFSLREDMSPGIAVLGVFLIVTNSRPRLGAVLIAAGVAWFGIDKFVIMPAAGTWWFADIYKDLVAPGEKGYGSIIRTIVTNPTYLFSTLLTREKLIYALHLFAPLAFLPLQRPTLALLSSPGFFFTLMTTGYAAATSIYFQYPGHWVAYLFCATVFAIRLISQADPHKATAALSALLLGVAAHSVSFGVLVHPTDAGGGAGKVALAPTPEEARTYEAVIQLRNMIPKEASVVATEFEVPLLSARPNAYSAALSDTGADYALINPDHFVLDAKNHLRKHFKEEPYGLVAKRGGVYLFKRGHDSPGTAQALTDLGLR